MLKVYRNLKGYIPHICAIVVLIFIQVLTDLYLPTLMSDIVNTGIMKNDVSFIIHEGGLMLGVAGIGIACAILASLIGSRVSIGLGSILRSKIFRQIERFSLREFDQFGSSTLVTRTTNDIVQIQTVTVLIINMMLRAPLTAIGGIILAYRQDSSLTLIFAVALPALVIVVALIMTRAIPLFKKVQGKLDKINLVLRENLTGIRVIRAFNRINHEEKRFDTASNDLTSTYIRVNQIMAFLMPVLMLLMNAMQIAIIWFGSTRVDTGSLNIGALSAFIQYASLILINFIMMSMMFIFIPRAQAAAERVTEVLEVKPDIVDPESPQKSVTGNGYLEFRNVSFRYNGAERSALTGVSFLAKPGETTAIIGSTGSGKSTLANLIPRFYDVENGEILIDGVDIRKMTQENLRSRIGFVPQKAILFTGTIKDNMRYGRENATDEEIIHAAQVAQASDFVGEMKNGYDTLLSEGGLNLSGGQKQRLSIARALVRRPEIYVFDDSFSALDFKTDAKLRAALSNETENSTVLIVAQRVGTVMSADRIIVLDEGTVAGIGKHEELMKTCEVYREIVSSQLSEEELA
ncbi:MAG TPA: multidrug ABC transporter ATP-binding protein [Ruminococcaceae bacterium]|nr:multidrug ABC transporter ATP-binding protein [Oscillospiraceae bacterium]